MAHRSNPYTPRFATERARDLRQQSTIPERLLWGLLRGRRLNGLKFRRQVPIGRYVVDYLCEQAAVVVELDGMTHVGEGQRDDERTANLKRLGLLVVRVTNDDVVRDVTAVGEYILRVAEQRIAMRRASKS